MAMQVWDQEAGHDHDGSLTASHPVAWKEEEEQLNEPAMMGLVLTFGDQIHNWVCVTEVMCIMTCTLLCNEAQSHIIILRLCPF